MLKKELMAKHISELEPASWYSYESLVYKGFLDEGFDYKHYFLHKDGKMLGGSVIHFLKGLYGIRFDNRDYLDLFTLTDAIGNPEVFDYVKEHPYLPTEVVVDGSKIPLLFIGKVKGLQHLIKEEKDEKDEKDVLDLLPEVEVDDFSKIAYVSNHPNATLEEIHKETDLPFDFIEVLRYKLGVVEPPERWYAEQLRRRIDRLTGKTAVSKSGSKKSKKEIKGGDGDGENGRGYTISEAMESTGMSYEEISRAIDVGELEARVIMEKRKGNVPVPIYRIDMDSLEKFGSNGKSLKVRTRREENILRVRRAGEKFPQWSFAFYGKGFSYGVNSFMNDINKNRLLTKKEEEKLLLRIEKGDSLAVNDLVEAHLPFVRAVAVKEYNPRLNLELLDLIEEGVIGLVNAAHRWDRKKAKGNSYCFQTYAIWWVRQAIRNAKKKDKLVYNSTASQRTPGVMRVINYLTQNFFRNPTVEEIAEEVDLSVEAVRKVLEGNRRVLSLDQPFKKEDADNLYDVIVSRGAEEGFEVMFKRLDECVVEDVLKELPAREAEMIRLYFGIDRERGFTLREIGGRFGLSMERARQIVKNGMERLRDPVRRRKLEEVFYET